MAALKVRIVLCSLMIWTISEACRPEWDNQCDKDSECCSGLRCVRGNPSWATGVCRKDEGGSGSNPTTTNPGSGSNPAARGECSWYGEDGEIPPGSYTSCGDIFNRDARTAAQLGALSHRYPCGTRVRVTNEANGRSVDVVLNDVGTHAGRILDLSYAAFGEIEDRAKGVTPCSFLVLS